MARFYETTFGVYFDDLDPFGILHNARYLLFFERAIGEFWHEHGWGGPLDAQQNPDQFHVVRKNSLEYLRPFDGVGQIRVRLHIEQIGTTSITFGVRMMPTDEDVEYARGRRILVRVSPETRRPVPWTDEFRAALMPYVQPQSA